MTCSENGWTDSEIGRNWLEHVFDAETGEKAKGKPRVLIVDGHSSHYTADFIRYARENNIIVLGYPPHCTHALQGLDVVCFAKMKDKWKKEITAHEEKTLKPVGKSDFLGVFGRAYNAAFTPDTVKAAFKVTGIVPFNRNAISEDQMKPSIATSVKGSFPLPQPGVVRTVMAAIDQNPPTSFSISPSTHRVASGSQNEPPVTPMRRQRQCPDDIDPDLYTPTKRLRRLYSTLGSNEEHRFLVSKSPLTSATPIAAPVLEGPLHIPLPDWSLQKRSDSKIWKSRRQLENEISELKNNLTIAEMHSHAQDSIIQGAHAQLVVQDLHLRKLNVALNTNEGKKKNERAILFEGKGQLFTSDAFFKKVEDQKAQKEAAAAKKISSAASRAVRKEAQANLDAEWIRLKKTHEEATNAWKLTCGSLKEQRIPKKNWPKAPTRPRKPKLPSNHADGDDDEPDDDGEENNVNDEA